MKKALAAIPLLLAVSLLLLPGSGESQSPMLQRNLKMTCIECHADPAVGGFHGAFRPMTDLTPDQVSVVCMSCHDGSYRNPQGIDAPQANVHTVLGGEFGTWTINCLDCHNNHYDLLAGDGSGQRNIFLLGTRVIHASVPDDGIARIRRPFIFDTNGDNGAGANHTDDVMQGFYCNDNPVTGLPNPCTVTALPSASDTIRKMTFRVIAVDTAQLIANPWANNFAQGFTSNGRNFSDLGLPGTGNNPSSTRWYDGGCNTCHTREPTHHKRDNNGVPGERDHNQDVAEGCIKCHNHKDFFTNKK